MTRCDAERTSTPYAAPSLGIHVERDVYLYCENVGYSSQCIHPALPSTPGRTVVNLSSVSSYWTFFALCAAAAGTGILAVMFISRRQRKADAALRLRNRAIESSVNAVMIAGLDRTIEYANPAFARITSHAAAEVNGRDMALLFDGEANGADVAEIHAAIAGRREGHASSTWRTIWITGPSFPPSFPWRIC